MLTWLLGAFAIASLTLGLIVTTIGLYGVLRMPDVYSRLHAAGMASGLGVITILVASVATRNPAVITHAALVAAFLLLTAPISSHAIAWAAHRQRAARPGEIEPRDTTASHPR
jgi:multicomponent Na+:H+ antiporter subunit G